MSERIRVGVSGFGYWGSKLARNVHSSVDADLIAVCDPDPANRDAAAVFGTSVTTDFDEMLDSVDVVFIASPSGEHYQQGVRALQAGRHVSIEKPITLNSRQSQHLVQIAEEGDLRLMSGHTFLYSPAVGVCKQVIEEGKLGRVLYAYSQRLSLGAFRDDIDAVWDLAPHDISILLHLISTEPLSASCRKQRHLNDKADVGFSQMKFTNEASAHIHSSRLDPRRVRVMTIVGEDAMLVYDDADTREPVKIYESSAKIQSVGLKSASESLSEYAVQFSHGPTTAPLVPPVEPMRAQVEDMLSAIREERTPRSDGRIGDQVVRVLEAFDLSDEEDGRTVSCE